MRSEKKFEGGCDQRLFEEVLHYNNADEVWKRCYKTNIQICWISVLVDLKDNEIVLQSISTGTHFYKCLCFISNFKKYRLYILQRHL